MDLTKYNSSSEGEETTALPLADKVIKYKVQTAPEVEIEKQDIYKNYIKEDKNSAKKVGGLATRSIMEINIPYEHMPKQEDLSNHPSEKAQQLLAKQGVYGHLEPQSYSDYHFMAQNHNFLSRGFAKDPSINTLDDKGNLGRGMDGTGYVGDVEKFNHYNGIDVGLEMPKKIRKEIKSKRKSKGDVAVLEGENAYLGPWAGYQEDKTDEPPEASLEDLTKEALSEEEEEKKKKKVRELAEGMESSIFHGTEERDYLGRTYMHIPLDLDVDLHAEPGSVQNFLPKKLIHTWEGHAKGTSCARLFPGSGHLLLSCGMDSKVKLWDVYHERELLRSYIGHNKTIREVNFSSDGSRFISCSYDRFIKIWDTETGQCIRTITTGKIPYTAKFMPDPNRQNIIMAGFSDKKIIQFDINSGNIKQEYDQHLGAINSITFVDDNKRFMSTSDDKTLRVWENDIPVVIKYVAEPHMHSMPSVSLHPSKKYVACQSLDNQILIYGAKGRFSQNNKKRFTGHVVAGYACQPNFSPDGRFLISGDADGSLWFWDWKTTKVLKKMKCHKSVLIGCEWHPHETSKVVTWSWDGSIKYWD